jgi:hypothetical protein
MSSVFRRASALVASAALVLTGATLLATPAHATAATPTENGATWLTAQLTGGVIHNSQYDFDDIGLTIDVGLTLDELGGHGSTVSAVDDALASKIAGSSGYAQGDEYAFSPPYAFVQHGYYANATAKSLVFAQATGQNTATWAGVNLVTALEHRVIASGPSAGRIADDSSYGDYASTFGQAFAARALATAGSAKAAPVLAFLLKQQCSAGFFRLYFNPSKTAANQTCDGGTAQQSPADPDATSMAVLQLAAQRSNPAVAAALAKARSWLLAAQKPDGSFGGGPSTPDANANSTALAGRALAALGECTAPARAAAWVRDLQVPSGTTGPLAGEVGAIAYDQAAMTAGGTDGITTQTQDSWRRTTAPAVPVLLSLLDSADVAISGPAGYQRGGSSVAFTISGLGAGDRGCLSTTRGRRLLTGTGAPLVTSVVLPATTQNAHIGVASADDSAQAVVKVLGRTTLRVSLSRSRVHPGKLVGVTVRGLAAGEKVTLRLRGATVKTGVADARGRFFRYLVVRRPLGFASIVAWGQFADIRRGSAVVRVVR